MDGEAVSIEWAKARMAAANIRRPGMGSPYPRKTPFLKDMTVGATRFERATSTSRT